MSWDEQCFGNRLIDELTRVGLLPPAASISKVVIEMAMDDFVKIHYTAMASGELEDIDWQKVCAGKPWTACKEAT